MASGPGERVPERAAGVRWLLALATALLLWLVPFVNFVRHHGYAWTAPEMLGCLAILCALGAAWGVSMAVSEPVLRSLLAAILLTLLVDIEKQSFGIRGRDLAPIFLGVSIPCLLLRTHLTAILSVALTAMLLTTLLLPGHEPHQAFVGESRGGRGAAAGPPIVHLILDEQTGIQGIPREFDPDGAVANQLRSFYLDRDFDVFPRAYSRYFNSEDSLAMLVNLAGDARPSRFYAGRFREGMPIRRNRYFGWMSARGYEIDVYQTDYVDFCHPGTPVRIRSCFTYALETIKSIESAPLTTDVKVRIIAGMYARLSSLLSKLRDGYETLRKASATRGFELPAWSGNVGRVSPASTMPVFDILARKLETITPGTLVFAHLAMPHYPYAYDRECNIRPDPNTWLNGADLPAFPSRNNAESRAIRYPAYLEQVLCTHRKLDELFTRMKTAGTYEGSVIIVQGDHGSRITLAPPAERNEDRMTTTDYVDAFSTLYAIHRVSGSGRSDDRMIPIDLLLGRFVKRGDAPVGSEPLEPQPVYLHGRKGTKLPRAMPNF